VSHRHRWGAAAVLACLGLTAVVAIAADGRPLDAPLAGDRIDVSGWVMVLLGALLLLGVAIAVLAVWAIVTAPRMRAQTRGRRSHLRSALLLGAAAIVLLLVGPQARGGKHDPAPTPAPPVQASTADVPEPRHMPLWPLVLLGALSTVAIVGALTAGRRPARQPPESTAVAPANAAAAFDASFTALVDDPDPRTAVIAAYQVLLAWFDAGGLGRRPAEAPHEHLDRALAGLGLRAGPHAELLEVYDLARYSDHTLTTADRERALAAFAAARHELSAAVA
jgi:hypothetical protein